MESQVNPPIRSKLLLNGQLVEGQGPVEKIHDPSTGLMLAEVREASLDQVTEAVKAAGVAFKTWSKTTPAHRSGLLLKLADRIEARAEELSLLESLNCGKPYKSMLTEEMPAIIDVIRFLAGAARCLPGLAAGEYVPNHTSMIRRDPLGVVGTIAPWNFPLLIAAWKLVAPLAVGNTVVMKPSEQTPLTALAVAEILADLLPPGVVNILAGRGDSVGAALVSHPGVRMVSLTGDITTGQKVLQAAVKTLKRTSLELGGKAPVIVMDDADLESVVSTVRTAGYSNAGQDCCASCRIYAHAKIYDKLVAALEGAVKTIKIGPPRDASTELGPLISERQRERVASFVERAQQQKHMEILTGGARVAGPGFYFEPTLIVGAQHTDEIARREVFGPVVSVTSFDDPDEVVALANDSDYGLAASVWTNDAKLGMRIAASMQYGTVWVNQHFTLLSEMPHGGLKMSGYGKDMSLYSLEDYTAIRHVMVRCA
jgi:aminobutyraldehyde dehydrogenase